MSDPKIQPQTTSTAPSRWLSIVGIGEDGVDGLSATARGLISGADLVVGGKRHLALANTLISGRQMPWPSPITDAIPTLKDNKGRPVVVLASGDPFHYGVGALLAENFDSGEILCLPQPSAFALAASKLAWSIPDTNLITLHGRPFEILSRHLRPNARILALSWDGSTPQKVAQLLAQRGLGQARLVVLESLGGPNERIREQRAADFDLTDIAPLNTLALDLPAKAEDTKTNCVFASLTPGLDDAAFDHDGQLTKRDIRAITISALSPRPGELLWDIGLGAGSIAIEWLLAEPSLRAIGFERDKVRAARALSNAANLGTPDLQVVTGSAPQVLDGQPPPDAVFIGGGLSAEDLFEKTWEVLKPGGRLVANAVTLESEAKITDLHARLGGQLIKIEISQAGPVGRMRGWRSSMPVIQWRVTK